MSGPVASDPVPAGTVRATCVRAANPGPMTLSGTNTWLLAEPGADELVVIDPGPDLPDHRAAILAATHGRRVDRILLTHGHPDHAEGAPALAAATGAPVLALDPAHRLGDEGLRGGDVIEVAGLELAVVPTPGHTSDSLSFVLPADAALLTGDTVLGWGPTVVAHPDGRLADYLDSLRRLRDEVDAAGLEVLLPGHGPQRDGVGVVVAGYQAHRAERLEQLRAAVRSGARTATEVVEAVYADVHPSLWPAAELSVLAQLDYLRETGEL